MGYNTYGVWPTWYTGYYTNGLALWGRKKREATSEPEGKSEADAWLYYNTYGYWPSWWAGYGGYGLGLYGRKKREATSAPEGKSAADAWLYYNTYESGHHGGPVMVLMG